MIDVLGQMPATMGAFAPRVLLVDDDEFDAVRGLVSPILRAQG